MKRKTHVQYCTAHMYQLVFLIITSEDTGVFILCVALQNELNCNIFIRCGSAACTKLIDLKKVASDLDTNVSIVLIGLHSNMGCDTVSSFSGFGKVKAFNLLMSNQKFQRAFAA